MTFLDSIDKEYVYISFRAAEAQSEAFALTSALRQNGVDVLISNTNPTEPGVNSPCVQDAIMNATLVVVLGTKKYGKRTAVTCSSYDEMRCILTCQKPVFFIKMCHEFKYKRTQEFWQKISPFTSNVVFLPENLHCVSQHRKIDDELLVTCNLDHVIKMLFKAVHLAQEDLNVIGKVETENPIVSHSPSPPTAPCVARPSSAPAQMKGKRSTRCGISHQHTSSCEQFESSVTKQNSLVGGIIAMMASHSDDIDIQQQGCIALLEVLSELKVLSNLEDIFECVLTALNSQLQDAITQQAGLQVLNFIALTMTGSKSSAATQSPEVITFDSTSSTDASTNIIYSIYISIACRHEAVAAAVNAMSSFPANVQIQKLGCSLLRYMTQRILWSNSNSEESCSFSSSSCSVSRSRESRSDTLSWSSNRVESAKASTSPTLSTNESMLQWSDSDNRHKSKTSVYVDGQTHHFDLNGQNNQPASRTCPDIVTDGQRKERANTSLSPSFNRFEGENGCLSTRRRAVQSGAIRAVIDALRKHNQDDVLVEKACLALENLLQDGMGARDQAMDFGGIDVLVEVLSQY